MPPPNPQTRQIVAAVTRSVPLDTPELPEEFFPAHLSVALIDAVFRTQGASPARAAPRYCAYFGLTRTRAPRWSLPRPDKQEPLGALVGHYGVLGMHRMTHEVFRTPEPLPGMSVSPPACILQLARTLQGEGIEVLQNLAGLSPEDVGYVLQPASAIEWHIVHLLLMYAAPDDYVHADHPIRRFVAEATGQSVSAARARTLVRQAAHELILSPRFLYHEVWKRGLTNGAPGNRHSIGSGAPVQGADPVRRRARRYGASPRTGLAPLPVAGNSPHE